MAMFIGGAPRTIGVPEIWEAALKPIGIQWGQVSPNAELSY